MSIDFDITEVPADISSLPRDTIPDVIQVEYPCKQCGREAGPYKGRGRKPTMCEECKPKRSGQSVPKVGGSTATMAAQATQVLSQVNAFAAVGLTSLGLFGTASAIAAHDETFREQAYAALITDPELCKFILKGGVKSAKLALLLAYGGLGVAVAPVAKVELKDLQARHKAKKAEREAEVKG